MTQDSRKKQLNYAFQSSSTGSLNCSNKSPSEKKDVIQFLKRQLEKKKTQQVMLAAQISKEKIQKKKPKEKQQNKNIVDLDSTGGGKNNKNSQHVYKNSDNPSSINKIKNYYQNNKGPNNKLINNIYQIDSDSSESLEIVVVDNPNFDKEIHSQKYQQKQNISLANFQKSDDLINNIVNNKNNKTGGLSEQKQIDLDSFRFEMNERRKKHSDSSTTGTGLRARNTSIVDSRLAPSIHTRAKGEVKNYNEFLPWDRDKGRNGTKYKDKMEEKPFKQGRYQFAKTSQTFKKPNHDNHPLSQQLKQSKLKVINIDPPPAPKEKYGDMRFYTKKAPERTHRPQQIKLLQVMGYQHDQKLRALRKKERMQKKKQQKEREQIQKKQQIKRMTNKVESWLGLTKNQKGEDSCNSSQSDHLAFDSDQGGLQNLDIMDQIENQQKMIEGADFTTEEEKQYMRKVIGNRNSNVHPLSSATQGGYGLAQAAQVFQLSNNSFPFVKAILSHKFTDKLKIPETKKIPNVFEDADVYKKTFHYLIINECIADLHQRIKGLQKNNSKVQRINVRILDRFKNQNGMSEFKLQQITQIMKQQKKLLNQPSSIPTPAQSQQNHQQSKPFLLKNYSISKNRLGLLTNIDRVSLDKYGVNSLWNSNHTVKQCKFAFLCMLKTPESKNDLRQQSVIVYACVKQSQIPLSEPCYFYDLQKLSTSIRQYLSISHIQYSQLSSHVYNPRIIDRQSPAMVPTYVQSCIDPLLSQLELTFNPTQFQSIREMVLRESGIVLLQGPPGTGKTSTLLGLLAAQYAFLKRTGDTRKIMICAPSNAAVDHIIKRLKTEGLMAEPEERQEREERKKKNRGLELRGDRQKKIEKQKQRKGKIQMQEVQKNGLMQIQQQPLQESENDCDCDYVESNRDQQLEVEQKRQYDLSTSPHHSVVFPRIIRAGIVESQDPDILSCSLDHLCQQKLIQHRAQQSSSANLTTAQIRQQLIQIQKKIRQLSLEQTKVRQRKKFSQKYLQSLQAQRKAKQSDYVRMQSRLYSFRKDKIISRKFYQQQQKRLLQRTQIIVSTLCSSGVDKLDVLRGNIACLIVDEAAQATEPGLLIALQTGVRKVLLIGDPLQLPATTMSPDSNVTLFNRSLFERFIDAGIRPYFLNIQYRMAPMIRKFPSERFYGGRLQDGMNVLAGGELKEFISPVQSQSKGIICQQMPSPLQSSQMPNPKPDSTYRKVPICLAPFNQRNVMFIDIRYGRQQNNDKSFCNYDEAVFIKKFIQRKLLMDEEISIGVITPYQAQKKLLIRKLGLGEGGMRRCKGEDGNMSKNKNMKDKNKISHTSDKIDKTALDSVNNNNNIAEQGELQAASESNPELPCSNIMVNTIDSFQGQQKDLIIISTVRANPNKQIGFLTDQRRVNVAITRAKHALIIVGNGNTLASNEVWSEYLDQLEQNRLYWLIKDMKNEQSLLSKLWEEGRFAGTDGGLAGIQSKGLKDKRIDRKRYSKQEMTFDQRKIQRKQIEKMDFVKGEGRRNKQQQQELLRRRSSSISRTGGTKVRHSMEKMNIKRTDQSQLHNQPQSHLQYQQKALMLSHQSHQSRSSSSYYIQNSSLKGSNSKTSQNSNSISYNSRNYPQNSEQQMQIRQNQRIQKNIQKQKIQHHQQQQQMQRQLQQLRSHQGTQSIRRKQNAKGELQPPQPESEYEVEARKLLQIKRKKEQEHREFESTEKRVRQLEKQMVKDDFYKGLFN